MACNIQLTQRNLHVINKGPVQHYVSLNIQFQLEMHQMLMLILKGSSTCFHFEILWQSIKLFSYMAGLKWAMVSVNGGAPKDMSH